jgi:hypothetical protein
MRTFKLTLHVWRQKSARDQGKFVEYKATDVSETCRSSRCSTS